MKPVVYVDVLFLFNFVINYLLLLTTKKLCKNPSKPWRLSLGAFTGSVYAVLMFFPSLAIYYTVLAKLVFSSILILISLRITKWKEFMRTLLIFYAVNFLYAGAAFGLFYFTDFGSTIGAVVSNGIFYIDLPLGMVLLTSACAYLLIWLCNRIYATKMARCGKYYDICIRFHGNQANLHALLDTGNSLTDPLTGKPVIVAEFSSIRQLFGEDITEIFSRHQNDEMGLVSVMLGQEHASTNFRLIPFSALGKENGLLLAFVPDGVDVLTEELTVKDVLIGVYNNKLSKNEEYRALLHPGLFAGI